jgi:capsular exopolysaccharide synthesis family protein
MQLVSYQAQACQLLVTSAMSGEGKSFVAANMAISLAQSGKRVILVDANLRRPSLHEFFGLSRDLGLSYLLMGNNINPTTILRPTSGPNLSVLTAGALPDQPSELLSLPSITEIMRQLASRADVVIYDAASVIPTADALVLVPHMDVVIHVVRAGAASADLVVGCKLALQRAGARAIKPVLNRAKQGGYWRVHRAAPPFVENVWPQRRSSIHQNERRPASGKAATEATVLDTNEFRNGKL